MSTNGKGYTVFSVPVGVLYRPSEAKIKNAQKKDYLGQAKLIAATNAKDGFIGFTGAEIKKVSELSGSSTSQPQESDRSPEASTASSFATHELVKTDIKTSKSMRGRSRSETSRDKSQNTFPLKPNSDRGVPKYFPPTPPSEAENFTLQRSRSRSQPATSRSATRSSAESSDYVGAPRTRLDTVRDEDDRRGAEMRRVRSLNGGGRNRDDRAALNRSRSRRDVNNQGNYGDDIYDLYSDYSDVKPLTRKLTNRRPLQRSMSRSRTPPSSRNRYRDDEEDYSPQYSDIEDEEFEMITPRRTEISKVILS